MAGAGSRRRLNEAIGALHRVVGSPRLNATIADRSGVALGSGSLRVLGVVLEAGPIDLSRLAERSLLAPNALTRHVKALEAWGYVSRAALPGDRRVSVVTATPEGRDALRRFLRANDRMMAGSLAGWTDHDLDALSSGLERLVADLRRPAAMAGGPTTSTPAKERTA
ncbi:MAG: MarR family winged helix-turn-helix transcriptional regulator [Actinomycetota bacterium]